jgi:hypothetical protein
MTHRELFLYWSTVGFQILLCVLVYFRNLQRRLPFFTIHATLLLAGTLGMQLVYHHFGFRSSPSYYAAWVSAGMVDITRALAIAELCRYELRAYQGIWALTWRILVLLAIFFLAHAAFDAHGQIGYIAIYGLTIERDVAISSIAILLALLSIRTYYGLTLEPLHMWIAIGICVISIVTIMNNNMFFEVLTARLFYWVVDKHAPSPPGLWSQVESANDLWNIVRTSSFIVSISAWCYALRKPLQAPVKDPVLLPVEVYRELSPAVNLRLRAFNERLLELLKS